jgi:hypothetical protein
MRQREAELYVGHNVVITTLDGAEIAALLQGVSGKETRLLKDGMRVQGPHLDDIYGMELRDKP